MVEGEVGIQPDFGFAGGGETDHVVADCDVFLELVDCHEAD